MPSVRPKEVPEVKRSGITVLTRSGRSERNHAQCPTEGSPRSETEWDNGTDTKWQK